MRELLCVIVAGVCCGSSTVWGQALPPVPLPKPQTSGGKPLMQALSERKTSREMRMEKLPVQLLSNLLWAAFGVNRPEIDHRTAPSAMNAQEIDLFIVTAEGVFLYDARANQLLPKLSEDLRSQTGGQDFGKVAPVTVLFVADHAKMVKAKPEQKDFYAGVDTGYISQNLYLFCASEGLATVVHDLDRAPLTAALKLRPDQKIVLAQAVGYPK